MAVDKEGGRQHLLRCLLLVLAAARVLLLLLLRRRLLSLFYVWSHSYWYDNSELATTTAVSIFYVSIYLCSLRSRQAAYS